VGEAERGKETFARPYAELFFSPSLFFFFFFGNVTACSSQFCAVCGCRGEGVPTNL
jgi:hypothetical protein